MIFEAIRFAAYAHSGQYRKGTNIPYMSHLINVMKILCENNCKEEVIVAGILHDVVEDTSVTIDEIETGFGREVAFLVRGATEIQKLSKIRKESDEQSWKERKQHTIHFLTGEATCDQLLVSSADKLDNLRAIRDDFDRIGETLWTTRFNAGKEEQKWYYTAITAAFRNRADQFGEPLKGISDELTEIVGCLFDD